MQYIGVGGQDDEANTPDSSSRSLPKTTGALFIVQELMDGGTLRQVVRQVPPLLPPPSSHTHMHARNALSSLTAYGD